MPGPHGGYTQQELVDAGGTVYHPPSRQDITIVYYQPPGTTDRSQQIEFTQNPQTQEFRPKAGADTDRYNQYIGGGQSAPSTPAPAAAPSASAHSVTPSINPADRMASAITPSADQWRDLVSQYFKPEDVDKALYVILHESGGNPGAMGDGGHSVGLFQLNNAGGLATGMDMNALRDPETNIRLAAQAVYGGSGWSPWGENALYNGNPFGSLGAAPYPGAPATAGAGNTPFGNQPNQQSSQRQGAAEPPSPRPEPKLVGYAPASAFPGFGRNHEMPDFQRGSKGDYPVFMGGRERNEFSLASAAPGSISLVSPQGGWGYNPFAIEAANGRFRDLPSVDVPQGRINEMPGGYGLNDYYEQARLAGSLVTPLSSIGFANRPGEVFVSPTLQGGDVNALSRSPSSNMYDTLNQFQEMGMQNLGNTMEGSFGNGVGTSTSQAYARGGGLVLRRPAHIVDDATGQAVASLVDSRNQTPEMITPRPGGFTVANHVPRYDDGGTIDFTGGGFGGGGSTAPVPSITAGPSGGSAGGAPPVYDPNAPPKTENGSPVIAGPGGGFSPPIETTAPTAPTSPGLDSSFIFGAHGKDGPFTPGGNNPPAYNPTPAASPWPGFGPNTSFSSLMGLGDLTMPVLPTRPGFGASADDWNAYDTALTQYYQDINNRWAQGNAAKTGLVNSLFDSSNGSFPNEIGRQQHTRDVTDYQYGKAGLSTPVEELPPLVIPGTGNPTTGLGPGLRYALLTPAQQFSRLYPLLGDYLSGLSSAPRPSFSSSGSSSRANASGGEVSSGGPGLAFVNGTSYIPNSAAYGLALNNHPGVFVKGMTA